MSTRECLVYCHPASIACLTEESVVDRLADSRTQVVEPFLRMVPVHDTPNESKLGRNVAAVPTDFISCGCGIAPHEFPDVRGPREYVGGVAQLRNLGHRRPAQLENELAAKEEDVDTALLQLVEKEAIIIRLPAQLKYVEIRGKPEFPAQIGQIPVLPRFVLEPLPDPGDVIIVLPEAVVPPPNMSV
jgi:hypothetical protein